MNTMTAHNKLKHPSLALIAVVVRQDDHITNLIGV